MAIRNAAKAIVLHNGRVLLNKCVEFDGETYYDLPGGGQNPFETMEEAVGRECLEETGLRIRVLRFAALCEEINDDIKMRRQYPDYAHRMFHIFIAEPTDDIACAPTETDFQQQECVWIDINAVSSLNIYPRVLAENFLRIIYSDAPLYLGSTHINQDRTGNV